MRVLILNFNGRSDVRGRCAEDAVRYVVDMRKCPGVGGVFIDGDCATSGAEVVSGKMEVNWELPVGN